MRLLNDIEIVSFSTVQQYADELGILAGPTSPLRGLLKTVVDHTSLVATAAAPAAGAPSLGTRLTQAGKDLFNKAQRTVTGTTGVAARYGDHTAFRAAPPA